MTVTQSGIEPDTFRLTATPRAPRSECSQHTIFEYIAIDLMYTHSSEVLHVFHFKLHVSYVAEVPRHLSFADKARGMFIFQSGG
jgi:hypothetical protein